MECVPVFEEAMGKYLYSRFTCWITHFVEVPGSLIAFQVPKFLVFHPVHWSLPLDYVVESPVQESDPKREYVVVGIGGQAFSRYLRL